MFNFKPEHKSPDYNSEGGKIGKATTKLGDLDVLKDLNKRLRLQESIVNNFLENKTDIPLIKTNLSEKWKDNEYHYNSCVKEAEYIKSLDQTPQERIDSLRDDFLQKLETGTLDEFDTDHFTGKGVYGSMFIHDKDMLNYIVSQVREVNEFGDLINNQLSKKEEDGPTFQGPLYLQKIKLSENASNNLKKMIEHTIKLQRKHDAEFPAGYNEYVDRLENALNILTNGYDTSRDEQEWNEAWDPRITVRSERFKE